MRTIYEPKGRAREYFKLACNPLIGCTHGCTYCYVPLMLKVKREYFHEATYFRKGFMAQLAKDAPEFANSQDHCLLSFTSDMFQLPENKKNVAKFNAEIISILHGSNIPVAYLTKGSIPWEVLELLTPSDTVGITLTSSDMSCLEWEPNAAIPGMRILNLVNAQSLDIPTFVSIEPVIDPVQSLAAIRRAAPYTDRFLVGTANYIGSKVDWKQFYADVIALFKELNITKYYIKQSLLEAAGCNW